MSWTSFIQSIATKTGGLLSKTRPTIEFDDDVFTVTDNPISKRTEISAAGVLSVGQGIRVRSMWVDLSEYATLDGTVQTSQFLSAVSAVQEGGTLYVPEGVCLLDGSQGSTLDIETSITIRGKGRNSILRTSYANGGFHALRLLANDIGIHDIAIEGGATDQVVVSPLTRCPYAVWTDATQYSPKRVRITGCYFGERVLGHSLNNAIKQDSQCDYWIVEGCHFVRLIGDDATAAIGAGYMILNGTSSNCSYLNNKFIGDQYQSVPMGHHAVYITGGGSNNIVAGNYVYNTAQAAFPIQGNIGYPSTNHNTFHGNICKKIGYGSVSGYGSGLDGHAGRDGGGVIEFSGPCAYNKAFGNKFYDCYLPGIVHNNVGRVDDCHDNEDYDNTIVRSAQEGTRILGGKRIYSFNRVVDCSFFQGDSGEIQTPIDQGSVAAVYLIADTSGFDEACVDCSVGVEALSEREFYIGASTGVTTNPIVVDTYGLFRAYSITSANPMVITLTELCDGVNTDTVYVSGAVGSTTANGTHANCTFGTATLHAGTPDEVTVSTITLTGVDGHLDSSYNSTYPAAVYARKNHKGQGSHVAQIVGVSSGNTALNGERTYSTFAAEDYPTTYLSKISIPTAGTAAFAWEPTARILLPTMRVGIRHNTTSPVPLNTVELPGTSILPINGVAIDRGSSSSVPTLHTRSGGIHVGAHPNTTPWRGTSGECGFGFINVGAASATIASSGDIRVAPTFTLKADRVGGAGDIAVITGDNSDGYDFGDDNANTIRLVSANLVRVRVGGTVAQFQASAITFNQDVTFSSANFTWVNTVASPLIRQADLTTDSATGQTLTIHAQNETGATSTGGALLLASGTGTSAAGALTLKTGSTTRLQANATGLGLYTATPVAQASRVNQLTDSTTGSTASNSGALVDVGGAFDQTKLNDNLAKLAAKINAIETALHNLGVTA